MAHSLMVKKRELKVDLIVRTTKSVLKWPDKCTTAIASECWTPPQGLLPLSHHTVDITDASGMNSTYSRVTQSRLKDSSKNMQFTKKFRSLPLTLESLWGQGRGQKASSWTFWPL